MKKILYGIYPFLIAAYPILALRNYNIAYVDLASTVRTLLLAILLTAFFWVLLFVIFRNWTKAGIAASLAIMLVLSYGHLHIQSAAVFGEPIRHSLLLILLTTIYIGFLWLANRTASSITITRNFLSVTALILVVMSLGQSLYYDLTTLHASTALTDQTARPEQIQAAANRPDIYLILLDAHGRQDVLLQKFGYDNSAFLQGLRDLGFYVADCSQSNYASTNLSLSSVFTTNYIPINLSSNPKLPPFKESLLSKTLKGLGYTVITFENRASGHFDLQEDIRLSQNQLLLGQLNLTGGINEFEEMMLRTSIMKLFWDTELIPGFDEKTLVRLENYEHYKQTRFILSDLPHVPVMRSPKFVFVHILVPHDPFIFTADGKFKKTEDKSHNGYRDNAEFIDRNILKSIQALLAESERPPVIVLMGDHGPPPGKFATREDRMKILNAYYVDNQTRADLYPSITPVNSFRIILNDYFGESYPLLEDISHYAYKLSQLEKAPIIENTCTSAQ